ncbi:hypothetical protein CORC01_12921 [Colletotrichum orchidophilum]|uniref:Uncharacterized protein n=1 Tax=Colletotrichum orchidophilum TaxID=1209926 RepID=A0A1G4ARJ4_9PEZI|nr:uncharacterized protein CORC01_12921 [Colletotrichum orchidophilum]OHE91794.1 hypothetical protein CORC01_12921 [Colletotrichum orchidophilum]
MGYTTQREMNTPLRRNDRQHLPVSSLPSPTSLQQFNQSFTTPNRISGQGLSEPAVPQDLSILQSLPQGRCNLCQSKRYLLGWFMSEGQFLPLAQPQPQPEIKRENVVLNPASTSETLFQEDETIQLDDIDELWNQMEQTANSHQEQ